MITLPENQHLCLILRIHLEGRFWQRPINTFSCCRGLLHVFSVLHSHCTAEMLIACPWSPAGSADPENGQYQAPPLPCPEAAAASHRPDTLKAPLHVLRASAGCQDTRGRGVFLGLNIVAGNLRQCSSFWPNLRHGTCSGLPPLLSLATLDNSMLLWWHLGRIQIWSLQLAFSKSTLIGMCN